MNKGRARRAADAEGGTVQPIGAAREGCRARGIPRLVDATAGLGRAPTPTPGSYDVLAGEARSWAGPPGLGVLIVPAGTRWRRDAPPPELEGGRSDIEPVLPLALAAAEAWRQPAADPPEPAPARPVPARPRGLRAPPASGGG